MGLDMYLYRKININDYKKITGNIELYKEGKKIPIGLEDFEVLEKGVCYWRKANAIHKFFVDNVQNGEDDCKTYFVEEENLKDLLYKCKKIKSNCKLVDGKLTNQKFAEELLPTQSGFFFGSTEYDTNYMADIEDTIIMLEKILEEQKELDKLGINTYYEYVSWW